jgi:hypothetical protein
MQGGIESLTYRAVYQKWQRNYKLSKAKTDHSPTNALFIKLGRFKLYTIIHMNFAPTCFGLRRSSGSLY